MELKPLLFSIFTFVVSPLVFVLRLPLRGCVAIVEAAIPVYRCKVEGMRAEALYECPSLTALWRAKTLYSKEPDTIEWLNSLREGDILYDVGANVGMYSIYAGLRGVRVLCFEPEAKNFALLNRNIRLNNLQDTVSAYCLAVGVRTEFSHLHLSSDEVGGAVNNFGGAIDYNGKPFSPTFTQGAISMPMDDLWAIHGLPKPNHIKIDVDGLEALIISGAEATLRLDDLKSVLIELNDQLPSDMAIAEQMKQRGFRCESKFHAQMFDDTEYRHIYNYIFSKPQHNDLSL